MRLSIVATLLFALGLTFTATPAAAQGDLGAGVSFLSGEGDTGVGAAADYSEVFRTFTRGRLGWVGDFSIHNFGDFDATIATFMGGVRYSDTPIPELTWFAQGIAGFAVLSNGDTDAEFTIAPGGGIIVPVTERLSLKAQLDFVTITSDGENGDFRRFWFGVSLPLGMR